MIDRTFHIWWAVALAGLSFASPEPTAAPVPTKASYRQRRDIVSDPKSVAGDATSGIAGYATGVATLLSGAPSYVASGKSSSSPESIVQLLTEIVTGVPELYENLPTGTAVQSSLGLSDDDMAAIPTSIANFPPYANWTGEVWNVRFHGNIYKQRTFESSESRLHVEDYTDKRCSKHV